MQTKTQLSEEVAEQFKTKIDELHTAYAKGIITQIEKLVRQAELVQEWSLTLANIWFNPE